MTEWKGPWRCEKCGVTLSGHRKQGFYHYPLDTRTGRQGPECLGDLVPYDRRTPDPEKQELVEALRAVLEDGRMECETAIYYGDDCVEKGTKHPCPVCRARALLRRIEGGEG